MNPTAEQVIEFARERGVVRPRGLAAQGLPRHLVLKVNVFLVWSRHGLWLLMLR